MKYVIALCLLLLPVGAEAAFSEAVGKIKIGVSLPLSGEQASFGDDARRVLLFANAKLAGSSYELILKDDQCSTKEAIKVANELVHVEKVKYVLGLICNRALLGAAALYEQSHTLVISGGASAWAVSKTGDYIFRTFPSEAAALRLLYVYLKARHRRVAILTEESDYAQWLAESLGQFGRSRPAFIRESFSGGSVDFQPMLARLKYQKPDALLVNAQASESYVRLAKQLAEMQWSLPLYRVYLPEAEKFLESAGALADGLTFVDEPALEHEFGPEARVLLDEFENKHGKLKELEFLFAAVYESFHALHQAISSGTPVKDFLYRSRFSGILGDYSFDRNGDIIGKFNALKIIKGGKAEILP